MRPLGWWQRVWVLFGAPLMLTMTIQSDGDLARQYMKARLVVVPRRWMRWLGAEEYVREVVWSREWHEPAVWRAGA